MKMRLRILLLLTIFLLADSGRGRKRKLDAAELEKNRAQAARFFFRRQCYEWYQISGPKQNQRHSASSDANLHKQRWGLEQT